MSFQHRRNGLLFLASGLFLFISAFDVGAKTTPDATRLPNIDVRLERAAKNKSVRPSADQLDGLKELQARVPEAQVDFDPLLNSPKWIRSPGAFLTGPKGQGRGISPETARAFDPRDPDRPLKALLHEYRKLFEHGDEIFQYTRKTRDWVRPPANFRTVVWEQELDGVPVYDSVLVAHMTGQGELVSLSSQMVPNIVRAAEHGQPRHKLLLKNPTIAARKAVQLSTRAIDEGVPEAEILPRGPAAMDPAAKHEFKAGNLPGFAEARLTWLPLDSSTMRLCWEVEATRRARGERFRLLIDVETGEVLLRRCLTFDLTGATYRVYTGESPSPFSPGLTTPSDWQPPLVPRELLTLSSLDTNASPVGWIADGENETRGNNVYAHLDRDADDLPDLPRPQGTPFRVFDFPLDLTQSPATYGDAATVQLFYWCNWMHDKLYALGFTEAAGNFQKDNFGRGLPAQAKDPIIADAQDGSGINNANFTTSRDGTPPRIQMFLFNGPNPWRDGDLDASVILHEYTHGLTDRLVGGGVGISIGDQPYALGEGWSDFYALCLLSKPGNPIGGNYIAGPYMAHKYSLLRDNYYFGIRRYPYTTNMSRNPLTFKHIYYDEIAANPNVPRSPILGTTIEVHRMGEVWCTALWEVRANLIAKLGHEQGNELALRLVTEGLGKTPPNPNFVQARNAILDADESFHQSTNHAAIWAGFAKRGMGVSASTWEVPLIGIDVQEAFDVPGGLSLEISPSLGFVSSGLTGGPFTPATASRTLRNLGQQECVWSAQVQQNWLSIVPNTGRLSTNSTTNIVLGVNANANLLPKGIYSNALSFINFSSGQIVTQWAVLRVDQGMLLSGGMVQDKFDLNFSTLRFTPDNFTNLYAVCKYPSSSFPTDPGGGQQISLLDDSYQLVTLTNDAEISILGVRSNKFFIGSNGDIVFSPPPSFTTNGAPHFYTHYFHAFFNGFSDAFRAGALYTDLDPSAVGLVSWKQLPDHVAVTWENVPEYGLSNANSFQIELFTNGMIRFTYCGVTVPDLSSQHVMIGFSRGLGFINYDMTDLRSSNSCYGYELIIPGQATEGGPPLTGVLRLAQPVAQDTLFTLSSSDTNALTAGEILVLAGQDAVDFPILLGDDLLVNGARSVMLVAKSPDFDEVRATIVIVDDETATLSLWIPPTATEGDGIVGGVIGISPAADTDIKVQLSSTQPALVQVPSSVTIPAGEVLADFNLQVLDDLHINETRPITVHGLVPNWTPATHVLEVADNESRQLLLRLPPRLAQTTFVRSNAGYIELGGYLETNSIIQLTSSHPAVLSVPQTVLIPAGSNSAYFDLAVIDHGETNDIAVSLGVSASGLLPTNSVVLIGGVDPPSVPISPSPANLAERITMSGVSLAWQTQEIEAPGSISFEVYIGTNSNLGSAELQGVTSDTNWPLPKLAFSQTYYWQIVATRGPHRVSGPIWQFITVRLSHFEISEVPSPQHFRVPFHVSVTALDENQQTALEFDGPANISALTPAATDTIVISEVDPNTDQVEFANVSGHNIEITGWQVALYDWVSWPEPRTIFTIPGRVVCASNDLFILQRSTPPGFPGAYPRFLLGTNLGWVYLAIGNPIAVLLRDSNGTVVDFMCAADANPAEISNPVAVPPNHWQGSAIPGNVVPVRSYLRYGNSDNNQSLDWTIGPTNAGSLNPSMSRNFIGTRSVPVSPSVISNFVQGVWTGPISAVDPATPIALRVDDGRGHCGTNSPFEVLTPDTLVLSVQPPGFAPRVGNNFICTLVVSNPGPAAATGVLVRNQTSTNAEIVSAASTQGAYDLIAHEVLFSLGSLPPGSNAIMTLILRSFTAGFVTNRALLSQAELTLPYKPVETVTPVSYPWVSIARTSVPEGDTNNVVDIPVVLSDPMPLPVSVQYFTTDGSARAGIDYVSASGTLLFLEGFNSVTIPITLLGNRSMESNKTFSIHLHQPSNAVVSLSPATITISNDDTFFNASVGILDTTMVEGDFGTNYAVFNVYLTAPLLRPATVHYSTSNGTATASLDYIPANGLIEFPVGVTNRTISIPVLADRLFEPAEKFFIRLSYPENMYIARSPASCTITDDDDTELHHFAWAVSGSTQFANVPFPVTLYALDASNRVLTDFTGAVNLHAGRQSQQIAIGAGTNLWEYPLGAYYQDTRLQVIYPAAQIARSGRISSLSLNVPAVPGQTLNSWTMRLNHTSLPDFKNALVWQDCPGTPMFQADFTFATPGWVTFNFQQAFQYNGTDNLLVDFSFNNSLSSTDGLVLSSLTNDYRAIGFRGDSLYGDPLTWSGNSPAPLAFSQCPNLMLSFDTPVLITPGSKSGTGFPSGGVTLVNGIWVGDINIGAVTPDVTLFASDAQGRSGASTPLRLLSFMASIEQLGNQALLTFPTLPGQHYQAEHSDSLIPSSWAPITTIIPGTGEAYRITNTITGAQPTFYRIRVIP